MAKLVWRSLHITFNISPPNSINAFFGTWLQGVDVQVAKLIRVGSCALFWVVWNCKNDLVFNRQRDIHFLQVIVRASALIRTWSLLTPVKAREPLVTGCIP